MDIAFSDAVCRARSYPNSYSLFHSEENQLLCITADICWYIACVNRLVVKVPGTVEVWHLYSQCVLVQVYDF